MKVVSHLLAAVIAAVLVLLPIARKFPSLGRDFAVVELIHTRDGVEKEIGDISSQLSLQLKALGTVIAQDRDFSMKMLVEHDPSAPEVAEIASRHMSAMGLAFLDITDAGFAVLSSGHFPARAGVSASEKARLLGEDASFIIDDAGEGPVLSLQSRTAFTCAGVEFFAMGGIAVDSVLLARLSPGPGVRTALKRGSVVTGLEGVTAMSPIENHTIIIDDQRYLAASIPVAIAGIEFEKTEIIILMNEPPKTSLLAVF